MGCNTILFDLSVSLGHESLACPQSRSQIFLSAFTVSGSASTKGTAFRFDNGPNMALCSPLFCVEIDGLANRGGEYSTIKLHSHKGLWRECCISAGIPKGQPA